jgi:SAM-dependent methyltransferase
LSEALPDWAPPGMGATTPSTARMYDYFLGGVHNFAIDRELARKVLEVVPDVTEIVQANRGFLHRAVRHLVAAGVRQFIDIGSGMPTEGNVHETALREDPTCRVLYVDHDPDAVEQCRRLLTGIANVGVLQADLRRPREILESGELATLIDLTQPVAVLMVAVLHFIREEEHPEDLVHQFYAALAPGSHLVISELTSDSRQAEWDQAVKLYDAASDPLVRRSRGQVQKIFGNWSLIEPGLVWVPEWRPDWPDAVGLDPSENAIVAAVAVKK